MERKVDLFQHVPQELKDRPQWVTWKYNSAEAKVPYNAYTGETAKSNDPTTWSTFEVAVKAYRARKHSGIGYVFAKDDPYAGGDLDDCIDEYGDVATWAEQIIAQVNTYTEISPSGTGVKWIGKAQLPSAVDVNGVEMYDHGRYFTITGRHLEGTPEQINDAHEAMNRLYATLKPEQPKRDTTAQNACYTTLDKTYLAEWAEKVIDRELAKMRAALDGEKHHTRMRVARTLGGLIPHGLATAEALEDAIYNANPPKETSKHSERKTIRQGISYGLENPLDLPPPPPEPIWDHQGFACCPTHKHPLSKSKKRGWFCNRTDNSTPSGWCNFWWRGDGYEHPLDTIKTATGTEIEAIMDNDPDLKGGCRALLRYLASEAGEIGWCRPSAADIEAATGYDARHLRRCYRRLEELGYLKTLEINGERSIRVLKLPEPEGADISAEIHETLENEEMSAPFNKVVAYISVQVSALDSSCTRDLNTNTDQSIINKPEFLENSAPARDPAVELFGWCAWWDNPPQPYQPAPKPQLPVYTPPAVVQGAADSLPVPKGPVAEYSASWAVGLEQPTYAGIKSYASMDANYKQLDRFRYVWRGWNPWHPVDEVVLHVEQATIDGNTTEISTQPKKKANRPRKQYTREELLRRISIDKNALKKATGGKAHGLRASIKRFEYLLQDLNERETEQAAATASRYEAVVAEHEGQIQALLDVFDIDGALAAAENLKLIEPTRYASWVELAGVVAQAA